ncbi:PKD domain-containing protein [bacterium SCSIO 12741]|nr:PKD domain-containing protein [bacterium SCSIO 12741]
MKTSLHLSIFTLSALAFILVLTGCEKPDVEPTVAIKNVPTNVKTGDVIQFYNDCKDVETYLWDFGVESGSPDVKTSTLADPTQMYTTPGHKIVTLTGTSKDGISESVQIGFSVQQSDPVSISVSEIVIFGNPLHVDWNTTTPDIYLKMVQLDTAKVLYTTEIKKDCIMNREYSFNTSSAPPFLYSLSSEKYQIEVWESKTGSPDSMIDAFKINGIQFTTGIRLNTQYSSKAHHVTAKYDYKMNYNY